MRAFALLVLLLVSAARAAEVTPVPVVRPVPDAERDGRELAAKLRSALPARDSEFTGVLVITSAEDVITEVPISSRITVGPTNWQVVYRAGARGDRPAETLTILHTVDSSTSYQLRIDADPAPATAASETLRGAQLLRPFAGSDFWVLDLGLEFFHWPQQRKLRHEMTRSRSCHVLESINPTPAPGAYARVVSWIDVETGGIIHVEAYDEAGGRVKDFKVGPFRKVDGQWQLESMKIRSRKTGQETEIKFDLQRK